MIRFFDEVRILFTFFNKPFDFSALGKSFQTHCLLLGENMILVWSAWNNGKHHKSGAGYGLKVPIGDRNRFFKKELASVTLELPTKNGFIEVFLNTDKTSFWNDKCHELISQEIGRWLRNAHLAPWPSGQPPKLSIEVISENRFRVLGITIQ